MGEGFTFSGSPASGVLAKSAKSPGFMVLAISAAAGDLATGISPCLNGLGHAHHASLFFAFCRHLLAPLDVVVVVHELVAGFDFRLHFVGSLNLAPAPVDPVKVFPENVGLVLL